MSIICALLLIRYSLFSEAKQFHHTCGSDFSEGQLLDTGVFDCGPLENVPHKYFI